MATNKKLTKFKSATTIVTADYANSIFGGLYGSSEADSLSADDPRVVGHIHDGGNADGHARKIDLVDHVDNQLLNQNLADNAVTKRNVRETEFPSEAIPESEEIDGTTYYYLDLRDLKGDLVFVEDDSENIVRQRSQTFDGTSYVDIAGVWGTTTGRDFVFGSSSLDDLASGTDGDSRFFFDKSKGAFRAGSVSGIEWDDASRGVNSVAFGGGTTASGAASFASGLTAVASGPYSFASGVGTTASGLASFSSGLLVTASGSNSVAFGGDSPGGKGPVVSTTSTGQASFAAGLGITASGDYSAGFGVKATSSGESSFAVGDTTTASGDKSFVSGQLNTVSGDYSASFGRSSLNDGEFSFSSGRSNHISISSEEYESAEVVRYASTAGAFAHSYAYGQHSQASGTFLSSQAPLDSYSNALPPSPTDWSLYIPDHGGAQTFVMTMFGNFQYDSASIDTINTEQKVIAQLDNFQDAASNRPFRPRKNASYSIKTFGTISFSKAPVGRGLSAIPSIRHSVSFIAYSGITVQYDGSMFYSTDTLEIIYDSLSVSGGTALDLVLPGVTATTDDFRLYFTHDTATPTNRPVAPGAYGIVGLVLQPGIMPPGHGFSFVLENRTFLNNLTPGTTTSQEVLYGEAISVRMEVTELNINLAKYLEL